MNFRLVNPVLLGATSLECVPSNLSTIKLTTFGNFPAAIVTGVRCVFVVPSYTDVPIVIPYNAVGGQNSNCENVLM